MEWEAEVDRSGDVIDQMRLADDMDDLDGLGVIRYQRD